MDRSIFYHLVAAVFHSYALAYPYYYKLYMPSRETYGGRLKFLTVWAHLLQVILPSRGLGTTGPPAGSKRGALTGFGAVLHGGLEIGGSCPLTSLAEFLTVWAHFLQVLS